MDKGTKFGITRDVWIKMLSTIKKCTVVDVRCMNTNVFYILFSLTSSSQVGVLEIFKFVFPSCY